MKQQAREIIPVHDSSCISFAEYFLGTFGPKTSCSPKDIQTNSVFTVGKMFVVFVCHANHVSILLTDCKF